jgi:hypothetical protein
MLYDRDPSEICVYGNTQTDVVGDIPRLGACMQADAPYRQKPPKRDAHLRIAQTYHGDISPMFGVKRAFENVYGPVIPQMHINVDAYPAHTKLRYIYL